MVGIPERNLEQIRSAISYLISNPNELTQKVALSAMVDLCTHVERLEEDIRGLKSARTLIPNESPAPQKSIQRRSIPKKSNQTRRK